MKWIDAGDIKRWVLAERRLCEEKLPELVSRLIWATSSSITKIDFPSGDSVTTGGWDGYLETSTASAFFPKGISGWEIGVEPSPGNKAEQDYRARTSKPSGLNKRKSSFVFVTPRPWPKRQDWEARKQKTKKWKSVRVIAADALEQWLASAPAVALWLARLLGKVTSDGVRDLEGVWDEWSMATKPSLLPPVVLAGRIKECEKIRNWISNEPSLLEVQGDSPDEALAFLYSAISTLGRDDQAKALSRCIVVTDILQFRSCVQAFKTPLIIAAPAECVEATGAAISGGHHVFLSVDAKVIDLRGGTVSLARPLRGTFEEALRANGFSKDDAQRHARESGSSVPVLRRRLSRSSSTRTPSWATTESAQTLLPFLLAGAWVDGKEGDQQVLEELSGKSYDTLVKEMQSISAADDSPLRHIGNVWMLKSPLDAWFLLARHLDAGHLKHFQQTINAVLTETDPKYDLSPDQRWAAALHGKTPRYSEWLREGLVESLVLLAVYGDRAAAAKISPQLFAATVVTDILTAAQSWQAWSSLKDETPLLAEAAPEAFIGIVEKKLEESPGLFS